MRKIIRAARQFWKGNFVGVGDGSTKRYYDFWSVYRNQRVFECNHPSYSYVVSRAISATGGELNRDGPVMEYGRRIAAGELLDGDASQVMYENRARLLCSAEGSPMELFEKVVTISDAATTRSLSEVCVDNDLGFAKDRTISRLTEMNSREYLEQHHHLHPNCN